MTEEEFLKAYHNDLPSDWLFQKREIVEKLLKAYHTAKLEEVSELPDKAGIEIACHADKTGEGLIAANWMRSIAQSAIAKEREEKKYAEEMRNLCAQQCEHKNKLILEVCAERDALKAEIERLKEEIETLKDDFKEQDERNNL